ncbi:MAG: EamA family transporter, partial [Limnohabitans sp.]
PTGPVAGARRASPPNAKHTPGQSARRLPRTQWLWATAIVYGAAFGLIVLGCAWRSVDWRAWRQQPALWALVIASGLTNVGFNWAVTVGDVVRVVLLFYLMPAWSIAVAWLLLGERPGHAALLRLLIALTGLFIVLKRPDMPWPVPESLADVLALLGGLSFAITNVLLLKLRHSPESARMLAMFGGGTLMAALAAVLGQLTGVVAHGAAPSVQWLPFLGLLTGAFLLGNLALQYGAARLASHTTALVMLSEVVFAAVSSVILGAAQWDARTGIGGALILAAALLSVLPGPQQERP